MDYVQVVYDRTMSNGLPGSLDGINDVRINTFIADADVEFGRVIHATQFGNPCKAAMGGGTIAATAGKLVGSAILATIAQFQAITNGGIKVKIDGSDVSLTALDFSGISNYGGVADVINTALSTNGTCTFDPDTQCFTIASATTGSSSSVTSVDDIATYTSLIEALGFGGTPTVVPGVASYTATILGISCRSVTVEAAPAPNSNKPIVRKGDVGAFVAEGDVKVLLKEDCTAMGDVYYDETTGEIYASSAAGRSKLGSTKFPVSASAGQVIVIDLMGVRY